MPEFKSRIIGIAHINASIAEDWVNVPINVAVSSRFCLPVDPFADRNARSRESMFANTNRLSRELENLYNDQVAALSHSS